MLLKKFFKFVVPSVVSMWIFACYSIVDGIFVAKGVGPVALAAVNLSMPFTNFVFAVGLLFATGTSTMISFALGEKRKEDARQIFSQNLVVVSVVAVLITALVLLNLRQFAHFLGATEHTVGYVIDYIRFIAGFSIFFMISYNLEVQVRANGAPQVSTIGVAACGILNIVLDYVFVMRMNMGIGGAALATGLAQALSTAIFIVYFLTHRQNLRIQKFPIHLRLYKKILKLGIPNSFMELSNGLSILVFNLAILRVIGEAGVVCYTVLAYILSFVANTMSGITQGIQPLVSFHYGAREHQAYKKLLSYGLTAVFIISLFIFIFLEICPQVVVSIFLEKSNSGIYLYTVRAMRLFAVSFLIMGFNVLLSGYFTAIDIPKFSFVISVCRSFVFSIGCLTLMATVFRDDGIWLTTTVSELLTLGVTIFFYRRWSKECTENENKHEKRSEIMNIKTMLQHNSEHIV